MAKLKNIRRAVAYLKPRLGRVDAQGRKAPEPWRAWYSLKRWAELRWTVLVRDLFTCQWPGCGRLEPDTSKLVADHRTPHRGNPRLFWDEANLWCLCADCHAKAKQREELGLTGG